MKKLAIAFILAIASVTAAFAQDVSPSGVSTTTASQPAALPTAQDIATAAHKTGAFVGGIFNGTFKAGVALFSGLKAGALGTNTLDESAAKANAPAIDLPSNAASQDVPAVKAHTPAPVEDRSVYVTVSLAK